MPTHPDLILSPDDQPVSIRVEMPKWVRRRLRIIQAQRDQNVSDAVIQLIKDFDIEAMGR